MGRGNKLVGLMLGSSDMDVAVEKFWAIYIIHAAGVLRDKINNGSDHRAYNRITLAEELGIHRNRLSTLIRKFGITEIFESYANK